MEDFDLSKADPLEYFGVLPWAVEGEFDNRHSQPDLEILGYTLIFEAKNGRYVAYGFFKEYTDAEEFYKLNHEELEFAYTDDLVIMEVLNRFKV